MSGCPESEVWTFADQYDRPVAIANASQAWRIRWLAKLPESLDQQTGRDLLNAVGLTTRGCGAGSRSVRGRPRWPDRTVVVHGATMASRRARMVAQGVVIARSSTTGRLGEWFRDICRQQCAGPKAVVDRAIVWVGVPGAGGLEVRLSVRPAGCAAVGELRLPRVLGRSRSPTLRRPGASGGWANRPSRWTNRPTGTCSTKSGLTTQGRGAGSSSGSRTTSLARPHRSRADGRGWWRRG